MKKGFTIVEIIISISIVLIVGISTTFFIYNNKNNKELESITKEILEVANLYASTEKDENGEIYLNEVRKSKKGIQIPLHNLVSKGYVTEEQENQIKELTNNESYYIMLLEGNNEGYDYCGDGKIFSLASWTYHGNDIYLCDNSTGNTSNNNFLAGSRFFILYDILKDNHKVVYNEYTEGPQLSYQQFDITKMLKNIQYSMSKGENPTITYQLSFPTLDYWGMEGTGEKITDNNSSKEYNLFNGLLGIGYDYVYIGNVVNNYVKIGEEYYRILGFNFNYNTDGLLYPAHSIKLIKENAIDAKYVTGSDNYLNTIKNQLSVTNENIDKVFIKNKYFKSGNFLCGYNIINKTKYINSEGKLISSLENFGICEEEKTSYENYYGPITLFEARITGINSTINYPTDDYAISNSFLTTGDSTVTADPNTKILNNINNFNVINSYYTYSGTPSHIFIDGALANSTNYYLKNISHPVHDVVDYRPVITLDVCHLDFAYHEIYESNLEYGTATEIDRYPGNGTYSDPYIIKYTETNMCDEKRILPGTP